MDILMNYVINVIKEIQNKDNKDYIANYEKIEGFFIIVQNSKK